MDASPPDPLPRLNALGYAAGHPRRPTLHLWIFAAAAMLLEIPWAYIVGSMLWNGMGIDGGLASFRGVIAAIGISLPSLLAAGLVVLAVRRS